MIRIIASFFCFRCCWPDTKNNTTKTEDGHNSDWSDN